MTDTLPPDEREAFERYRARKLRRGETPKEVDGWQRARDWARQFWPEQQRRGHGFRDLTSMAIGSHGYTAARGWSTEVRLGAAGPRRTHDLGNEDLGFGIETKVGGGDRTAVLRQIQLDARAAARGQTRVWAHADLSRLKDPKVRAALDAAQRRFPQRFAVVDCSDPQSIAQFQERFPAHTAMGEAFRDAGQAFRHYEREHARARQEGRELSVPDAWQSFTRTQQAQQRVRASFARPATDIGRGPDLTPPESVRTTPTAEVARRREQAAGRSNAPLRHHTAPTRGPSGR
ncbi:hypothetical protein [Desertihabitans brevis]|uniref:hypothetical protein n=1 Tax=Desertihabitans brevis TaxID=2268447 RepID=UPI001314F748|nr:hypothetical protein [Desertihabitans brevis]